MPTNYTTYSVFEFHQGNCEMRATMASRETIKVRLLKTDTAAATRSATLLELFGTTVLSELSWDRLKLAKHGGLAVTEKKVESMATKCVQHHGATLSEWAFPLISFASPHSRCEQGQANKI